MARHWPGRALLRRRRQGPAAMPARDERSLEGTEPMPRRRAERRSLFTNVWDHAGNNPNAGSRKACMCVAPFDRPQAVGMLRRHDRRCFGSKRDLRSHCPVHDDPLASRPFTAPDEQISHRAGILPHVYACVYVSIHPSMQMSVHMSALMSMQSTAQHCG